MAQTANFDTTETLNITCREGDTFSMTLTLKDSSGTALPPATDGYTLSIQIKDSTLSNSAVKTLSEVAGQVSLRGSNWRKAFTPETEPKAFDPAAWAARMATARPDQLEAMIAALQAQRATVSKKKAA